jgi:two-component system sensor histidine kinase RegB
MALSLPPLVPLRDWLRVRTVAGAVLGVLGILGLAASVAGPVPAVVALAGAGLIASGLLVARLEAASAPVFLVDTLALTAVLATTGGPANPLVALYLLPVLVGALVLPPRWTWATYLATGAGYGSLFVLAPSPHMGHAGMAGHLVGMFAVHAATAPVVVLALHHARRVKALALAREREAQELQARTERLTALATLAAGAAHELATPLSTILVVARELELRSTTAEDVDDALLVREEVERCQQILHQLSADAGQGMGETPSAVELRALLDEVGGPEDMLREAPAQEVRLPRRLVVQALRRLVGNARDAGGTAPVQLRAELFDNGVQFSVVDNGVGMRPEALARAVEPFYTSKPPGAGTGLGLYFVHSVATALGGSLELDSVHGAGTTATLRLPLEAP